MNVQSEDNSRISQQRRDYIMTDMSRWMPSIPASDVVTGKKRNTLNDIVKGYPTDDITIFLLHDIYTSGGCFLTSFGGSSDEIGDVIIREHSQTFAKKEMQIVNIIKVENGEIVHMATDVGCDESDRKRPHWVMK